jgi:Ca2+-binding RTX toxin-like protein
MGKILRTLVALALVTGLATTTRAEAAPQPEGASSSNFSIDVIVRGTPPPAASITVSAPNSEFDTYDFALADADGTNDVFIVSGTIFRQVFVAAEDDAGAGAVAYACQMTGGPKTEPFSVCSAHGGLHKAAAGPHVDASFNGNANAQANVTITLTFGTCDGRPVTTFIGAGDTPTAGPDVILGTPGPNTINGLGGADHICGLGGTDTLRGGDGRDVVSGGNGVDRLEGGLLGDTLSGGAGTDTLVGQGGNDALDGGAQRDTCNGGPQRDTGVRCEVKTSIP